MASKAYYALLFAAIVWGLVLVLYPHHLQNLAYIVGLTLVGGALVQPASSLYHFARNPLRRRDLRQGRLATVATLALVGAVVILAWPVNYCVRAPLVLLPTNAARVYATVEGTIQSALVAGQEVSPHETIAALANPEVQLELARLEGEYELARLRLENLEKLRGQDEEAGPKIPAARATLADLAAQLADRRRDADRLTLTAPTAGIVISAPNTEPHDAKDGRLPGWSGNLLDARNRGAKVEAGTLICLVGDLNDVSAVLLVSDTDVARLAPGQRVRHDSRASPRPNPLG